MPRAEKTFVDKILEEYGDEILIREFTEGVPTISTGSTALDVSLGIGGIPCGRISEVFGPESSGKTTLALNIANQCINGGNKVLYIDTENSLDYGYAEDVIGKDFDRDRLVIVQPVSGEDAFKLAEAGIESNFRLIIFDSIAAISPEKELSDNFDDQHMALAPRLTSKFLRRNVADIRAKLIAFMFTNQVRANIGAYHGGFETPAGYALKHYASIRIFLSKGKEIKDGETKIGNMVNFVIKKNKLSIPFRSATTNIIYGLGIDFYRDLMSFGSLLGVLKTRGPYYTFEEETIAQGVDKSIEVLKANPDLLDKIVKMCYNVAGSVHTPVPMEVDEG